MTRVLGTRRWIIPVRYRRCRNSSCSGYSVQRVKAELVSTGRLTTTCPTCERVDVIDLHSYLSHRSCVSCGWQRDVKVTISTMNAADEWWEERCAACQLEASAFMHRQTARRHEEKARAIKEQRATKTKKTEATHE